MKTSAHGATRKLTVHNQLQYCSPKAIPHISDVKSHPESREYADDSTDYKC
ncbi:hypothetical protein JYU34_003825 [Plutella xylostella]|uniref:Uncharacterized protein n=1 Tax=Plutella xylostella TaxID=51655 RepID=A0ABQ7R105_PLUXY|nr:hypothetical protein JYU34_003825 [Plutella xylostella]